MPYALEAFRWLEKTPDSRSAITNFVVASRASIMGGNGDIELQRLSSRRWWGAHSVYHMWPCFAV